MSTEFSGLPFQYNPAVTNVNIDNQLSGILSRFNDDYIFDVIKESLNNRFKVYSLPKPNVVAAFENNFKQITNGFASYTDEISNTRRRVYTDIINIICNFYNFTFNSNDETDYYSAAYSLYDFFVCSFTEYIKNFYVMFLIRERNSIYSAMDLGNIRKENEPTFGYSKQLFKDPKLAAIHCNLETVIYQMGTFDITLPTIIETACMSNPSIGNYISSLVNDTTGRFFIDHYQRLIFNSPDSTDILTYIKLYLQQIGGEIEPEE